MQSLFSFIHSFIPYFISFHSDRKLCYLSLSATQLKSLFHCLLQYFILDVSSSVTVHVAANTNIYINCTNTPTLITNASIDGSDALIPHQINLTTVEDLRQHRKRDNECIIQELKTKTKQGQTQIKLYTLCTQQVTLSDDIWKLASDTKHSLLTCPHLPIWKQLLLLVQIKFELLSNVLSKYWTGLDHNVITYRLFFNRVVNLIFNWSLF